ncbi:GntR family transcriptional regulator [Nonomuraea sp. SYSU D8015]|uniref:GntR family transcriptional regulator n=1 Tax=Nonomuraea sp. SYSU D8015 TaxID=2593644 RepID=UPI0016615760|nr:GntR family transcriptional regulator [Nonomuraea sp. SYSU D8015]
MARWHAIAAELREAIRSGAYPPGTKIPKEEELERQFGCSRTTVRRAVAQLTAEGLLQPVRKGGTTVREHPPRQRLTRARQVYRDERGYYFDPTAQPWAAVETPTVSLGPVPYDIARILGVEPGEEVVIRSRVMGHPDTKTPTQLATSYLPASVARGTVLAEPDTGPGGIYDRLEEMGRGPLAWSESVVAAIPTEPEQEALHLPPGVALLRIVRVTRASDGQVVEVNDTRMSGELWEIGYQLERHQSAHPSS